MSNTTFTDNTAGTDGGAICNKGGTVNVTSSSFTNNTSSGEYNGGGAIFNYYSGSLTINSCTFTANTATTNGGAINVTAATLKVTNSTFTNNTASGDGGAIYDIGTGSESTIINFNRIVGNSKYDIYTTNVSLNTSYNWWGTNFSGTNPQTEGRINTTVSTWMVLGISAYPTSVFIRKYIHNHCYSALR